MLGCLTWSIVAWRGVGGSSAVIDSNYTKIGKEKHKLTFGLRVHGGVLEEGRVISAVLRLLRLVDTVMRCLPFSLSLRWLLNGLLLLLN